MLVLLPYFGVLRHNFNNLQHLLLSLIKPKIIPMSPLLKCLINKNFSIRFHLINKWRSKILPHIIKLCKFFHMTMNLIYHICNWSFKILHVSTVYCLRFVYCFEEFAHILFFTLVCLELFLEVFWGLGLGLFYFGY